MTPSEKEISYRTTNSYSTLNTLTEKTKNIWFVCHGMGYLSRYFLKYFKGLNPDENYIIAPQAQNKYYIQPAFKHVGASWLTKENTLKETENVLNNLDAILEAENIPADRNLIILGYSQGVSIALRLVASRKIQCSKLILMSGGIPKELNKEDFEFLSADIKHVFGTKDEFVDEERLKYESKRAYELFGKQVEIIQFEGVHEVNVELINSYA